jgi:hypothetical protein
VRRARPLRSRVALFLRKKQPTSAQTRRRAFSSQLASIIGAFSDTRAASGSP